MTLRASYAMAAAAALVACHGPGSPGPADVTGPTLSPAAAEADEPFTLAPGEAVRLADADLTVRFVEVAADSRCPADVTCVWEGDAAVVVETAHGGVERVWRLHAPGEQIGPRSVDVAGHRLTLVGLAPEPRSGQAIPAGDYRATLEVTSGDGAG